MNPVLKQLQGLLGADGRAARALMAPVAVVMILAMMVLPLPAFALDLLFTFNIAMALMVLMVAAYMIKPLDFAAFPTVILLTTLLRLSLNVASTRVVLMEGHTGAGAAGKVIESFGHFLIGGNFAVGLIVFAILVVINFVVITKGAGRVSEVTARFTLDAMPGRQMAIDADLNAGIIDDQVEHRKLRRQIHPLLGWLRRNRQVRPRGGALLPLRHQHRRYRAQAVVERSVDGGAGTHERDAQTHQPDRQQGREQPFQQPRGKTHCVRAAARGASSCPLIGLSVPLPTGLSMQ